MSFNKMVSCVEFNNCGVLAIFANMLVLFLCSGCSCNDSVDNGTTFWNGVVEREFSIYIKSSGTLSEWQQTPDAYMVVMSSNVEKSHSQIVAEGVRSEWSASHGSPNSSVKRKGGAYQHLFVYDAGDSGERPSYEVISFIVKEAYEITKSFWPEGVYKSSFKIDWMRFKNLYKQGFYDDSFYGDSIKVAVPMFMVGMNSEKDQSVRTFIVDIDFFTGSNSCVVDPNRATD